MRSWRSWFKVAASICCCISGTFIGTSLHAEPRDDLIQLVQQTRIKGCTNAGDALAHVLCVKTIRVGVRANYAGFGVSNKEKFDGFEIQVAQAFARELGVAVEFIPVSAANRIEKLINGEVDLIWATMAHTVAREKTIHFVRPHYYSSPTAIVGPHKIRVEGWSDQIGRAHV